MDLDVESFLAFAKTQKSAPEPPKVKALPKGAIHPKLPDVRVSDDAEVKTLTCYVTRRGLLLSLEEFDDLEIEQITRQLTYTFEQRRGKVVRSRVQAKLYEFVKVKGIPHIQIARHVPINKILAHTCYRYRYHLVREYKISGLEEARIPACYFAEAKLVPRLNQEIVANLFFEKYANRARILNGVAGGVVVMGTGEGKSYFTAHVTHRTRLRTLLIVPNTNCRKEWIEDVYRKHFPYLRVGVYEGDCYQMGDFLFMTANSAMSDYFWYPKLWEDYYYDASGNPTNVGRFPKVKQVKGEEIYDAGGNYDRMPWHQYFAKFGMVVFDEAHGFASPERIKLLWRTGTYLNLGLTATPDERPDGFDPVYQKHLGPVILANSLEGYQISTIKWTGRVVRIEYSGPPEFTKKLTSRKGQIREINVGEETNYGVMCQQLDWDVYRNRLVMSIVREAIKSGINLFVFTLRRSRVEKLCRWIGMLKVQVAAPELVTELKGGLDNDQVKKGQTGQIIVITYGYGAQSLSIPRMDGILWDVPCASGLRQKLGRILRMGGDSSITRVIYDIVDVKVPLKTQARERMQSYEDKEFPVEIRKADWNSYHVKDVCDLVVESKLSI